MEEKKTYLITVPCSSANIGPGFDVIGLALSMHLELHVTIWRPQSQPQKVPTITIPPTSSSLNCTLTYTGVSPSSINLDPASNLLTRSSLYLLRSHGHYTFPHPTHIHIHNPIPLGRGLGSSGAAVVAGILLGNLGLSSLSPSISLAKPRLLDYCLMIERHPDNVAAALYGGFVGTYLNELDPDDIARKEIPLSEVLPTLAGGLDTGLKPPEPPIGIGHFRRFKWAPEIKAVAVIPDFEVSTARAREVLPKLYTRQDMIFNLQRLALLTTVLGDSPPDASLIYQAMQDKMHQPYRQTLIPGLTEILQSVTPTTHTGLLGICLSGAGPTILALATGNFESIADVIIQQFARNGISCEWKVLEPAEGAAVKEIS